MKMHPGEVITQLRKDGYDVRVAHYRYYPEVDGFLTSRDLEDFARLTVQDASPFGGKTHVAIYKDEELIGEGVAVCRPDEQFDRREGLVIALGRALLPREERQRREERRLAEQLALRPQLVADARIGS